MTPCPDIALARDQIASYQDAGFLIVRRMFASEEVAKLDVEAARLMQRTDLMDSD